MKRVAIVGGGLSGTSAAWQLARERAHGHRIDFTLYEATDRLGGIVETERRDDFVIECGPDSWITEKPWARELAIELGLESEIVASNDGTRRTYLVKDGALIPIPDGMRMMVPTDLDAIRHSPLFSEQAVRAYEAEPSRAEELRRSAIRDGHDESVASFVRRHFGDEATDTLAGPLLAGVFGGSVEKLSVRAVMPAFVRMEREHGSLIAALQNRSGQSSSASGEGSSIFTSLRWGLQSFIDGMETALPTECVCFNTEVLAAAPENGRWIVTTQDGSEPYDALILATPAHVTRRLLASHDPAFSRLLDMEASSAIVVALAFEPKMAASISLPAGFGFLVPPAPNHRSEEEPALLACTFVHQKFPHRAPPGGALLRAFYGGDSAPELLGESDERLVALARRQLEKILGVLPDPSITVVRRWPRSLPQYAVGHLERMAELEALVKTFPGLALIGNGYYGVGVPDMIRQGREAARRFTAESA
jgi:protoporphyrinogen/coproporphyrinogen III oxidase